MSALGHTFSQGSYRIGNGNTSHLTPTCVPCAIKGKLTVWMSRSTKECVLNSTSTAVALLPRNAMTAQNFVYFVGSYNEDKR